RDVDIADLIGREPVRIDDFEIARCLEGRVVLVTGAAGSIGSELARQALKFRPGRLLLLDNNESDLFGLRQELCPRLGKAGITDVQMIVGDIRDRRRIDHLVSTSRPHIVFHAAAYKHVPVMEAQPAEAVKTNVSGTRFVAEAAARHGAERFVFVSTDKAVNPSSVMGATKRVGETIISEIARASETIFAAVRFGNVLGSRGSVVPIFARQISEGGPITVTHPEVSRYFMTIEEAASLILQAAAIAKGGETFVLDMEEPVRILDLAERMRDLLARDHDDIEIAFTGLRPGEKLHEELWQADEVLGPTGHPRIHRAVVRQAQSSWPPRIEADLRRLEELAIWNAQPDEIRAHLFSLTSPRSQDPVAIPDSIMSDLASSPNA
ncbi:MAG TPA: polysaccharide biosynthesis protein, partial [Actinomycetota bacterium]